MRTVKKEIASPDKATVQPQEVSRRTSMSLPRVAVYNDDLKAKKYLLTQNYAARPDLDSSKAKELLVSSTYKRKELAPFRIATLIKNASGV